MNDHEAIGTAFREFVSIIKALRTPETGCPWDLEQDHRTLRPYLLEETYEVLDAIDRGHDDDLREELGDLLLQIVLHAQIAADRAAFTIEDVLRGIRAKMIRRHPHVFGKTKVTGSEEVTRNWEQIKAQEKVGRESSKPSALPALLRAQSVAKTQPIASDAELSACVVEGLKSLETASPADAEQAIGEMLFAMVRIARNKNVNAEDALRQTLTHMQRSV